MDPLRGRTFSRGVAGVSREPLRARVPARAARRPRDPKRGRVWRPGPCVAGCMLREGVCVWGASGVAALLCLAGGCAQGRGESAGVEEAGAGDSAIRTPPPPEHDAGADASVDAPPPVHCPAVAGSGSTITFSPSPAIAPDPIELDATGTGPWVYVGMTVQNATTT